MSGHQTELQPVNMRRVPAEWEELLTIARQDIRTTTGFTDAPGLLPDAVGNLSNEKLDTNRYYGLGYMACLLARQLCDEKTRQKAVTESAETLAVHVRLASNERDSEGQWLRRRAGRKLAPPAAETPPRVRLNDLDAGALKSGFEDVTRQVNAYTLPDVRYLADTLTIEELRRIGSAAFIQPAPTAYALQKDILTGTAHTYIGAYRAEHGIGQSENPVITARQLRALDIGHAMAQLASLHADTFNASVNRDDPGIYRLEDGSLRAAPEVMANRPEDLDEHFTVNWGGTLHQRTLRCPALHITGLLPMMQRIVPDIVEGAERLLQAA